jgi:putative PIN family toxin of toxin-antitoxin system
VPRAVLDTDVLVAALITPNGASARLLLELRAGAFELVVSPKVLAELRDVLSRPEFEPHVSAGEIDAYIELIQRESIVVEDPAPSPQPLSGDPDDDYLIVLAHAARVNALVTGDAHLLDLRDTVPTMTPREFLESLTAGI